MQFQARELMKGHSSCSKVEKVEPFRNSNECERVEIFENCFKVLNTRQSCSMECIERE